MWWLTVELRHGSNVPVINREDVMVYQGPPIGPKVTDWSPIARRGVQDFTCSILIDDAASTELSVRSWKTYANSSMRSPQPRRSAWRICETAPRKVLENPTSDHTQAAKALSASVGRPGRVWPAPTSAWLNLIPSVWPEGPVRCEIHILMISDGIVSLWGWRTQ